MSLVSVNLTLGMSLVNAMLTPVSVKLTLVNHQLVLS